MKAGKKRLPAFQPTMNNHGHVRIVEELLCLGDPQRKWRDARWKIYLQHCLLNDYDPIEDFDDAAMTHVAQMKEHGLKATSLRTYIRACSAVTVS